MRNRLVPKATITNLQDNLLSCDAVQSAILVTACRPLNFTVPVGENFKTNKAFYIVAHSNAFVELGEK